MATEDLVDNAECAFCALWFGTDSLRRGVLYSGRRLFVLDPVGALCEGFLLILPYSKTQPSHLQELDIIESCVAQFYEEVLGTTECVFYEQGRAGGGNRKDPTGRFRHHAHVCALPTAIDFQHLLRSYRSTELDETQEIIAVNRPYVRTKQKSDEQLMQTLFLPGSKEQATRLERLRLREAIAQSIGMASMGDWRRAKSESSKNMSLAPKFTEWMHGVRA
ncbi:MAG: hypothetical protein ACTH2Q_01440 [Propionibacteriaceae bacterium]